MRGVTGSTETLEPSGPAPLWTQLADLLRQRLGRGDYLDRFPTEMELAAEFDVSRATVREAIRRLRAEGFLDARRGSGTFVVRRELEQPLIGSLGLARAIAAAGLEERSTVRFAGEREAGQVAGGVLGLSPTATVVVVERTREAGGRPLALDSSAFSLSGPARRRFLAADLARGSLYDTLSERCGVRVTGASEVAHAVTGATEERSLLSLGKGEGALEVRRVSYADGRPVEWRRSLLRGSAFELSAGWGAIPPG